MPWVSGGLVMRMGRGINRERTGVVSGRMKRWVEAGDLFHMP